jgi:hypothetical protein
MIDHLYTTTTDLVHAYEHHLSTYVITTGLNCMGACDFQFYKNKSWVINNKEPLSQKKNKEPPVGHWILQWTPSMKKKQSLLSTRSCFISLDHISN